MHSSYNDHTQQNPMKIAYANVCSFIIKYSLITANSTHKIISSALKGLRQCRLLYCAMTCRHHEKWSSKKRDENVDKEKITAFNR